MNIKNNYKYAIVGIVLIAAGLVSPSNGVDAQSFKKPLELLVTALALIAVHVLAYVAIIASSKNIENNTPRPE